MKRFILYALGWVALVSTPAFAQSAGPSFIPADGPAFAEAGKHLERQEFATALEVMRRHIKAVGPNLPRQGMVCGLMVAVSRFDELGTCIEELLGLVETLQDKVPRDEVAQAYSTAALAYSEMGDFPRGIEVSRRGVALSRGQARLSMQVTLAVLLGSAGEDAALRALLAEVNAVEPEAVANEAAAAFRARMEGLDPKGVAAGRHDKAIAQVRERELRGVPVLKHSVRQNVAFGLRDYPLLLRLFEERDVLLPRFIAESGGKSDPLSEAWGAYGRAWILLKLGRYSEAKTWLDKAVQHQVAAHWSYPAAAGELAAREGKSTDAIAHFQAAIGRIESQRSSTKGEDQRINVMHDKQEVYVSLVLALLESKRSAEAFEVAERGKARTLVELLASRQSFGGARAKSGQASRVEVQALLDRLRAAETGLKQGEGASSANADAARRNLQIVQTEIRERMPATAALVTVQPIPLAQIQASLQKNEVLVEYFGDAERLLAFVVTPAAVRAVRLDAGILKSVAGFREAVQNPSTREVIAQGERLYNALIAPLAVPVGAMLSLVPHADLHYLPFAALANQGKWLADRHRLRILPSASVLPELANRPKPSDGRLLILGNPDVGEPKLDLPGAENEARQIARMRPDAKVLLRREASKAAFQDLGSQYGFVHLASHGTFDARKPRASGLLLATQGSGNPLAGMMTVDDLYDLTLDADLVTLSACETALGSVKTGDDVIGLTRGLFYAGARSIVSSLWQVDDKATADLMVEFYRLLPTQPKAEALRNAQRAIRSKWPHPYYWAAFQLSGLD